MIFMKKLVLSLFFLVVTMVGQENWPVQDISLKPKGLFIKIGLRSLFKKQDHLKKIGPTMTFIRKLVLSFFGW